MTKILWVTGGLMNNQKLAEAIRQVPEKECMVVKVTSVQEAICRICEGDDTVSLVICDKLLEMSIPKRELRTIANLKHIPYLVANDEEPDLMATHHFYVPKDPWLKRLLEQLKVKNVDGARADMPAACPL